MQLPTSWRHLFLVLMGGGLLLLAACGGKSERPSPTTVPAPDRPMLLPAPPPVSAGALDTVLPQDSIPAIDDPQFQAADEVDDVAPDERLIAVEINGDARAYPLTILSSHEIVNDEIGGEPVAVTWCPLCYTALVFSRRVPGRDTPLTFGVSGKLLHNTLVMVDRQTGSLWSQLYGGAVAGTQQGASLAVFPSALTTWDEWRTLYPNGRVLSKSATCRQFDCSSPARYAVDPYESYYQAPDEGIIDYQIPRQAGNRGAKKRVLGVRAGGEARGYPYAELAQRPLHHDQLGGVPLLVWFRADTETAVVFDRRIEERAAPLTFHLAEDNPAFFIDEATGSRWRAPDGTAVSGPLAGERLRRIPATSAFEFGWEAYFPGSVSSDR